METSSTSSAPISLLTEMSSKRFEQMAYGDKSSYEHVYNDVTSEDNSETDYNDKKNNAGDVSIDDIINDSKAQYSR